MAGAEGFLGYILGPCGALVYAIWHNGKAEKREEDKNKKWENAMAAQVTMVKEMAEAHKATAEAIKEELKTCHTNYESILNKMDGLIEKNGYLTAKVEILEERLKEET